MPESDRYPIDPDASIFGCNRLGHNWDKHGDCRHCPANQEDMEPPEVQYGLG